MVTERDLKLEARLIAIEYMIAHLNRVINRAVGATPEMGEAARAKFREGLKETYFPDLDPVKSDLLAAELEEAFERLFEKVKEIEEAERS